MPKLFFRGAGACLFMAVMSCQSQNKSLRLFVRGLILKYELAVLLRFVFGLYAESRESLGYYRAHCDTVQSTAN
jgi:hypothetical protein